MTAPAGRPTASTGRPPAPTRAQVAAAVDRTVPDVIADGLRVLFCGINPGLYTGATGWHFGRPGNRFWPTLHSAGFTARRLHPWEQRELLGLGYGITNLVERATARADELSAAELAAGAVALTGKVARHRPRWLAVLGVTAYRTAFRLPGARVGPQPDRIAGAGVWVLPNPSGLNASWSAPRLAEAFGDLRRRADAGPAG